LQEEEEEEEDEDEETEEDAIDRMKSEILENYENDVSLVTGTVVSSIKRWLQLRFYCDSTAIERFQIGVVSR